MHSYRTIERDEAQQNPEYWSVVESLFEGSSRLREPLSIDKAYEHARKIKKADWINLDFSENDFVRNLFKALRLRLISQDEMVTALCLYEAHAQHTDIVSKQAPNIRQYSYMQAGPYHPRSVSYATEENQKEFFNELPTVATNQQCYFTINLSKSQEFDFFFYGFNGKNDILIDNAIFQKLLAEYFTARKLDKMVKLVDELKTSNKNHAAADIHQFLLDEKKNLKPQNLTSSREEIFLDRKSIGLLTSSFYTNEQCPSYILSPDYANDPTSPLIAIVIPSSASYRLLSRAMHGTDAVDAYYTVGPISTRTISKRDSHYNQRPVELFHPDVKSDARVNGYISKNYSKMLHDTTHIWRSSSNPYKTLIRFIKAILIKYKKFDMSKPIWFLSDLDNNIGMQVRVMTNNTPESLAENIRKKFLAYIINQAGYDFWNFSANHDHNLMLICSMILENESWTRLIGMSPEVYFREKETPHHSFLLAYERLETFIKEYPDRSVIFYILAFRLQNHNNGMELIKFLNELGLDNFLRWHQQAGLFVTDELVGKKVDIETLDSHQLFDLLLSAAYKYLVTHPEVCTQAREEELVRLEALAANESAKSIGVYGKAILGGVLLFGAYQVGRSLAWETTPRI